jgi:hypothetical protein
MTFDANAVRSLRVFLPAKDFVASKRFYLEMGFSATFETEHAAVMALGHHAFILQNFYVEAWAENCMMQLVVDDLDGWWNWLDRDGLASRYRVRTPVPPCLQPWGLKVAFLFDPSSVLWHVTQASVNPQE